jgi:hypothetical protein
MGIIAAQPAKVASCFGMPPQIIPVMGPQGPQAMPLRPNTLEDDQACSLFKPKITLSN